MKKDLKNMDFFDLVEKRRSIRKFSNENVPEEVIMKALKAALLAANSSNLQPWEFYWVRDKNKKEDLITACFSQNAAKTAQELIVAVSRIDTWRRNRDLILKDYKEKKRLIPIIEKYYNKAIPISYILPAKTEIIASLSFKVGNMCLIWLRVNIAVMFRWIFSSTSVFIVSRVETPFVYVIGIFTKTLEPRDASFLAWATISS